MKRGDDPWQPAKGSALLGTLRWITALLVVLVVHGAAVWMAWDRQTVAPTPNDPPPAVIIDMAPLAMAPEVPPEAVAPGPQMTEAQPETTPTETAEPVEPDPVPASQAQTVQEVKPDITPALLPSEVKVPDLPRSESTEALPPPPLPQPKVQKKPPPKKSVAEKKKPIDPHRPKQLQTSAPPSAQVRRSDVAAAPSSGSNSLPSVSPATWRSQVMARLNRRKRYPRGASGAGTVTIAFTLTPSGQALSARLIGSSGDGALDAEAVTLPSRASPLPAPPPGISGGGSVTLTIPVHFERED